MGISKPFAEVILREHSFSPLSESVMVIGRQTTQIEKQEVIPFAKKCGVKIKGDVENLKIDKETRASHGNSFITDEAFFSLLGINKLLSVDVSNYGGASIVHDLNTPIPPYLQNITKNIVDGSTLDNVFDPAMTLRNFTRMMKPNGRLFSYNMGSNHNCPYFILTPLWLYDYFIVNKFKYVQVLVLIFNSHGYNVLMVEPQVVKNTPPAWTPNVYMDGVSMALIVMAEKGEETTWEASPVQHQYRSSDDYDNYLKCAMQAMNSSKPSLLASSIDPFITPPPGYILVRKGVI